MKRYFLSLFLFAVASIVNAQQIKGRIINSTTSGVVENARILDVTTGVIVFSDARGEFEITSNQKTLRLEITAKSYYIKKVEIPVADLLEIALLPLPEMLSEVIVKGSVFSNELRQVPASVGMLTKKDLERIDAGNMVQVFNNIPGIYVNQGALNTTKLSIRGIGARSQYNTNRIQAYLNEIPLTTGEGELTLDDLDVESLSSIEIIKGPTSSLYGAGLGGVINLYAKSENAEKTQTSAATQVGSYGFLKNTIVASHATADINVYANYNDLQSNGYRDNGSYKRQSGLVNIEFPSTNGNSLNVVANYTHLKAFIPSSLNEDDFINSPEKAAFTWGKSKGYESYNCGLLGVAYTTNIAPKLKNTTATYINFKNAFEPRPFDILKEERISTGMRTKFRYLTEFFELPSDLVFGGEYYREWYEMATFQNLYEENEGQGSLRGSQLSNNEQDRSYVNFFGQFKVEATKSLDLEMGLNFNTTQYQLNDIFENDDLDQSGNYKFKTVLSPRLAASYEVASQKNIYASISHGFSTPSVSETLTPEGEINTSLKPETGINYEIGFKGNWFNNALYTELALYSIQVKNLLVAQRIAEDRYVGVNAGKTNHNGIELFTTYNLLVSDNIAINPYFNSAINFFEFEDFTNNEIDYSGKQLPGVPEYTFNLGMDITFFNSLRVYSSLMNVGQIALNDANSLFSDAYQLLNVKASYQLPLFKVMNLNLSAGINNLLNEKYASSILPNAVGFGGASPRYYYPGNPRNYFAGIGLNYIF
ncbi:TonB-dependent receptor [Gillisia sp. M10.2A]|uniref:TonB-dependent receptor n=1 Tax=Gillisia lutea TaxID=2909668 RepID=A0ABS9EI17_9FLAO|nr:TonB-dependent receptor [Gillisia lutea]MCF4102448.1 TonB-dependent receptor [Gillisia lutea]